MPNIAPAPGPQPSINPFTASSPDYLAAQMDLQRRQALAQALTQEGMSPIEFDPRGRISPWQGISKMASALMGGYMSQQNVQQGAKLQALANALTAQGGFGLGGSDQSSTGSGSGLQISNGPPRQAPSWSSGASGAPADASQPSANPPVTASSHAAAAYGASRGPLVMPGLSPQQSYTQYMMNPDAYTKALIDRSDNRTEFSKTLLSMGVDPSSLLGRQLMADQAAKLNYIAPVEMRAGGGLMDARTGQVQTMPAAAPGGFQNVQLADGSWGTVPVRGGVNAITQSTAAGEAGKAPFQVVDTFANGKPGKNYAGNVMQLPSVGGAPQQAASDSGPTFNIGGSPQQQAAVLADIARRGPTPEVRAAAAQRLQAVQAGSTGAANGVQTGPALGESQGAVNAQDELSKTWAQQQQAQTQAQSNIYTLQSLRALADRAITGGGGMFDKREFLARLGAYAGVPGAEQAATSTDLMNKYSSQLIAGLSARGMNTDAARDLVMAGSPNSKMQPGAIKEAVDGLIAREQMAQARTAALQPFADRRDPAGFQRAANSFDAVADPRLWQLRGMSPQQLQAFTAKMPAADAQQLIQKYQAAKQLGIFQ